MAKRKKRRSNKKSFTLNCRQINLPWFMDHLSQNSDSIIITHIFKIYIIDLKQKGNVQNSLCAD